MKAEPSTTIVRAWARLMRAQRLALAKIEGALKKAGLPPLAWYDVLLEVERAGECGVRPVELESRLLLAQYNLSRLLDRIEAAGYVERRECKEDARGQVVVILKKGKEVRRLMWPVYAAAIEEAVGSKLSKSDATNFDALLGKLSAKES